MIQSVFSEQFCGEDAAHTNRHHGGLGLDVQDAISAFAGGACAPGRRLVGVRSFGVRVNEKYRDSPV